MKVYQAVCAPELLPDYLQCNLCAHRSGFIIASNYELPSRIFQNICSSLISHGRSFTFLLIGWQKWDGRSIFIFEYTEIFIACRYSIGNHSANQLHCCKSFPIVIGVSIYLLISFFFFRQEFKNTSSRLPLNRLVVKLLSRWYIAVTAVWQRK